ncbi:MAG: hypothetical protein C6Y22_03160 [Hapalosiphonaceae cyanobacterium JJU2]|nr:MAG: hypothetical protein C6Y22_03160 [Hapalosiphonaceae cyanobacterium JJU2]
MFKKLGVGIGFGILLAINPIAMGENNSSNYHNNLLDKSNKKAIDVSQISIGGMKLGMKETEIIKQLGKPKSRTTKYDDVCYSSYITTWKYNGLEIEGLSTSSNASQSQVHFIKTSSSLYPTEKGIKVGDRISKAQKAYSAFLSRNDTKNDLVYSNDAYGGLVFSSNKQRRIKEIRLLGASC